ncbi:MAG: hypothetical protein EBZ98_02950 [Actinobacteria bacterium]|nr:hypothetical protein [Actinomycetota bacterium]NBU06162.1 hypothetical protein [Acidimicrobiia bacterium]NDE20597.1 hypothetical protein [Actinomycetota bacterium]NDF68015.1 hypothetical protein [Actinomycetota bacterium]
MFGIRAARTRTPSRKRVISAASPARRRAAFFAADSTRVFFGLDLALRVARRRERAMRRGYAARCGRPATVIVSDATTTV